MRKTFTRVYEWVTEYEDEKYNVGGWVPLGMKGRLDAGRGLQVTHDTLEHLCMDASLEQECIAFGVMAWGRGQSGNYFGHPGPNRLYADIKRDPAVVSYLMSYDLAEFMMMHGQMEKPKKLPHWIDHEEFFAALKKDVYHQILRRLDDEECNGDNAADEDDPRRESDYWDEHLAAMVEWMKIGMVRAEFMYGCNLSPDGFTQLFKRMENDPKTTDEPPDESALLVIKVNRESGTHTSKYAAPDQYFHDHLGMQFNHQF